MVADEPIHETCTAGPTAGALKRVARDGEIDLVAVEQPLEIRVASSPPRRSRTTSFRARAV
jgi:hypothetical protein